MEYRIIPRAEWGARYAPNHLTRPLGDLERWLHHSVTVAPDVVAPFDDDFAAVREIERITENRFGIGMAYSALFTPAGLIFEGHPIDRIGAHTAGHNTRGAGLCLVGNYDTMQPTAAQLGAVEWYLADGVRTGKWKSPTLSGGHKDTKATACPGKFGYAAIPTINASAPAVPVSNPTAPAAPAPVAGPGHTGGRNADGSLTLRVDGDRGPATISRWQEVMGTPIDGAITRPDSKLIRADQEFLNAVVPAQHIRALTGKDALVVDGDEGPRTVKVRQFLLYNAWAQRVLGRGPSIGDFDGDPGPETTTLHQHALNAASARSGRY